MKRKIRIPRHQIGKEIPANFRIVSTGQRGTGLQAQEKDCEGRLKSFKMLAYTGGRLMLAEFEYPVIVDLRGMSVSRSSLPIFRDHDASQIVGHTTSIEVGSQRIELDGLISAANNFAREIAESAGNGFPWECSIGARAQKMVFVDRGSSIRVNGQVFNGPVYVATKSVLKEVSFVAIGADEDGATAKVAATAAGKGLVMLNKFTVWVRAQGFNPKSLSDKQRKNMLATYKQIHAAAEGKPQDGEADPAKVTAADDDDDDDEPGVHAADDDDDDDDEPGVEGAGDDDDDDEPKPVKASGKKVIKAGFDLQAQREQIRQLQASEQRRAHKINEICAKFPKVKYKNESLAAKAIEAGWSAEKTELYAMRRDRPKAPATHIAPGRNDVDSKVMEAALLMATGHQEKFLGKHYDEKTMNAALDKRYRGLTLHALMDHAIHASGQYYTGNRKADDFIRATKRADRDLEANGFSTMRVANILENVANKTLIASYEAQEVVWNEFAALRNHSDFKGQSRCRLDAAGSFRKVGPDGELKHISMTDAKYTSQLETYGAIITLNRQMMINDDLGAFLEIPKQIGMMCAIRIEELFFTLLLSNTGNFFHTNNRNLITGTDSAMSLEGLNKAVQNFRKQVTPNGKPLMAAPRKILVPSTLEVTTDTLLAEKLLIGGIGAAVVPNRNPHAGKYSHKSSAYLDNTAITNENGQALSGQSTAAWYMFTDPNVLAAIGACFLNGQQRPTIESDDTPFDTLGMQWRGYCDFAVGWEDPVGAMKAVGA